MISQHWCAWRHHTQVRGYGYYSLVMFITLVEDQRSYDDITLITQAEQSVGVG